MQGEGTDEGEAVDVAEVDFAGEEEEGGEEEAEEDGAGEVGVVHYVLGDWVERVEYCECLIVRYVSSLFSQLFRAQIVSVARMYAALFTAKQQKPEDISKV